jgi:hypothetical protein
MCNILSHLLFINMKCPCCSIEFIPKSKLAKYCTRKCKDKVSQELRSKKPKTKTCSHCNSQFTPYTSLDKFCSANCRVENQKSKRSRRWNPEATAKRIGESNPAYRNGMYARETTKTADGNRLFLRNRNELKQDMIDKNGYLFCEHCKTTNTYQFETHHIIYRSEKPNHKHLHDKRNLILLCIQCHNDYHKSKLMREHLIKDRNLIDLFGSDIQYKKNVKQM